MSRPIREQIDACRPGSDDLALPELAELAAAVEQDRAVAAELACSQRFDQAVSVAMHELPVPAGLMERILAAAEANKPSPAPAVETAREAWTRRRWLKLVGSLAAAMLMAVIAWQFVPGRPRQISQEELRQAVALWTAPGGVPRTTWVTGPVPVIIPSGIRMPTQVRWQNVSAPGNWSTSAVAIDLNPPAMPSAMLIVVSSSAQFKIGTSPTRIALSGVAGQFDVVAWHSRSSKVLYVLIVDKKAGQSCDDFLPPRSEA